MMLTRLRDDPDRLLPLATLCALTLLPVYHRMYDAALLLPALAWAMLALGGPLRRNAIATLVCLSIFMVPFDVLPLIMKRTSALDGLSQTWIWRVFIFPHHALATLATAISLMWGMWSLMRLRQATPARTTQDRATAPMEDDDELADLAQPRG
jgi:hypothetical protein